MADGLITVLVPTSPIPSHPSTAVIEETLASIRARLPLARIIVMCDGVREEQAHRADDYQRYLRRLRDSDHGISMERFESFSHQGAMTTAVLKDVSTPLILFVEHDTPLVGKIDFDELSKAALHERVNVIRLHHEDSVLLPHRYLMLDSDPQMIEGVPLLRTVQWSQRPHLAKTEFYRWLTATYFGRDARTMIEDVVYSAVETEFREAGLAGWNKFKLWMYAPKGDMKRSTHLDGRAGEPKYSMTWAYEGPTPLGAPNPRKSDDPVDE